MKTKNLFFISLLLMPLVGCGNSAADFVKKHAQSKLITEQANQAGVFIEEASYQFGDDILITVNYENPNIKNVGEYMELLANRFFIADVRKPKLELPVTTSISEVTTTKKAPDGTVESSESHLVTTLYCSEIPPRADLLMIGFKGIGKHESAELATPPMYFLVQKGTDKPSVISTQTDAGEFFEATHYNEKFPKRAAKLNMNVVDDYYIKIYYAGKHEDGQIAVQYLYDIEGNSTLDNIIRIIEEETRLPFESEIITGNKTIKVSQFNYTKGTLLFFYDTLEEPDQIIIRRNNQKIVFDGKTKAVIQE